MPERRTIPRKVELAPALDYAVLRAEGLAHVQRLAKLVWTDHNLHDPGITTLEILAYALTDLAYRASFDARDLLTGPDGRLDPPRLSGLAPAHEVLTTGPRTIADYRRLLLRIQGVRNAWLDPMNDPQDPQRYRRSEVPIYADCSAGGLSFAEKGTTGHANHPVRLSGLYNVRVELEAHDLLGSMNETALTYQVRRGALKGAVFSFDSSDPAFLNGENPAHRLVSIDSVDVSAVPQGFSVRASLTLDTGQAETSVTLEKGLLRVIEDRPRFDRDALDVTASGVQAVLEGTAPDDPIPLWLEKQRRRGETLEALRCVLHAHRGLCEDFLSIDTVSTLRIGVCADIEIKPEADLEQVQARVFHEIEKYLSPPIRYHTLEEMLAQGLQPDQIFNGPFVDFGLTCNGAPVFTKPGFITDADLAASELRREVRTSDIVNLVVDIDGVEAIRDVQLRAYGADGLPLGTAQKWTLAVEPDHQPVLYAEGTKLLFHKSGIPYRAQITEFQRTLEHLRALARREVYVPPEQVLPLPAGRWRELGAFYSVQHDFPGTYMIGKAGISPAESPERIARARQLKGYLTFFDQILADYLGQLANLRRLYSLDTTLDRTWFSQYLTGIQGSLGAFEDEFFVDKNALSDAAKRVRIGESEEQFLERRNRVLDHLIARFAERFADYALLCFRLSGDRLKTSEELIRDKIQFLSEYPKLSRERGQAANLRPEPVALAWDSANVSGLERRVGRLMGIDNVERRDLFCLPHRDRLFSIRRSGSSFRVEILGAAGETLFSSQTFATAPAANAALAAAYLEIRNEGALAVAETQGATTFSLSIRSGATLLTHSSTFDTEVDAVMAARAIIDRYDELLESDLCNSEGMYLIEHILLRPMTKDYRLMKVCLPEECGFCGDEDPYSFRVSVVLPYWPERFRNSSFRALVERTLREEAPAHVQVKVCWVGQRHMLDLGIAYRNWLQERAAARPNGETLRVRAGTLIEVLESLTTVYPAASLHDCDAGEDETLVRLGSTALGIF